MSIGWGMSDGSLERQYVIGGVPVRPPMAGGAGEWSMRLRLMHIRDGVKEALALCPRSARVLQTELQRAWVEAERGLRNLPEPPDLDPLLPFGASVEL